MFMLIRDIIEVKIERSHTHLSYGYDGYVDILSINVSLLTLEIESRDGNRADICLTSDEARIIANELIQIAEYADGLAEDEN